MRIPSDARLAFGLLLSSILALAAFGVVGFGPLPARVLKDRGATAPQPSDAVEAGTEFVDITETCGLSNFAHDTGGMHSIADAIAPGLGLLDLDDDGDLDLVLLPGPSAPHGVTIWLNQLVERKRLYFIDATVRCGITWRGNAQGVCAGDVDGDGDLDIYVTALGLNLLLLNRRETGELRFDDVTAAAGVAGALWHWEKAVDPALPPLVKPGPPDGDPDPDGEFIVPEFSTGASFGDFDLDGRLDLYVAHYVQCFEKRVQFAQQRVLMGLDRSEPFVFQPRAFDPQPDRLYHQDAGTGQAAQPDQEANADGASPHFTDVTKEAHIDDPLGRGLGACFLLIDQNIYPDIYVANDASDNLFLRNVSAATDGAQAGGLTRRFIDSAVRFGLSDERSGMGVARGDADSDGDLDLLTTNWRFEPASLFLYHPDPRSAEAGGDPLEPYFEERSSDAGIYDSTYRLVGWGCVFFDYDNDGDADLFIGNGFTSPREGQLRCAPERPLLFRNRGDGHFEDVTASAGTGLKPSYSARGAVAGDLDRDGDLDLVLAQNNSPVVVLENKLGPGTNSLCVQVSFRPKRGDAANAVVTVESGTRRMVQELLSGGSYLSQGPFEAHFGLGKYPRADRVRVQWPYITPTPAVRDDIGSGVMKITAERSR